MLTLRSEIGHQEIFAPRASLYGADADGLLMAAEKMPTLQAVREDVQKLIALQRTGGPGRINAKLVQTLDEVPSGEPQVLPEALSWNVSLPSLFRFGFFAFGEDGLYSFPSVVKKLPCEEIASSPGPTGACDIRVEDVH